MDRRSARGRSLLDIAQFPQPLGYQGLIFRPHYGRWVFRRRGGRWLGDDYILFAGCLLHMPLTTLVTIAYVMGRNQLPREFSPRMVLADGVLSSAYIDARRLNHTAASGVGLAFGRTGGRRIPLHRLAKFGIGQFDCQVLGASPTPCYLQRQPDSGARRGGERSTREGSAGVHRRAESGGRATHPVQSGSDQRRRSRSHGEI